MTVAEKNTCLASLENSQSLLIDSLSDVGEELFLYKAAPDVWSIAEAIEHIILVESAIIGNLKALGSADPQEILEQSISNDKVMELSSNHQLKSKSLDQFLPKGIYTDKATAIAAFGQSRHQIVHFVNTNQLNLGAISFPHPRIGVLNGFNWLIFISGHCIKHVGQINGIKSNGAV